MKRKVISLMLAMAMLVTSVCTVFAAEPVDVKLETNLTDVIEFLADRTPDTEERRGEILNYIIMYMGSGNDRDMDTLINAVKEGTFGNDAGLEDLNNILGALKGSEDLRAAALLTLELIRAIPADERAEVIKGFGVKQSDKSRISYEIGDTDEADFDEALTDLYYNSEVYPTKLRKNIEEHVGMNSAENPYIVLNLFTAWKGCFRFTDDNSGTGFELDKVYTEYSDRLEERLGDYTLNGLAIENAEEVIEVLADAINDAYSTEVKDQMKVVLGDSNLNLYVPVEDDDDDNSGVAGSSGGRKPNNTPIVTPGQTGIPVPPSAAAYFPDTVNHWAKDYIASIATQGLVKGYDDGNFQPNWGITRQEMAVVLVRMMGLEGELGSVPAATYTDNNAIAAWAIDYVSLLSAKDIFKGYDDGEFKPQRVVTREEMIALVMRLYGETSADATLNYSDAENIGEWARKYVGQGTSLGIVEGRDNNMFCPKDDVTRAEASKILYGYLYLKNNK